jgi:endonuclease/exonuclease/phosphatase (EEP) superfamily protein YafD
MRWLDRLLLLCVTLVGVANILPLGARLSWMIDITTHFRLQYLVATAVVLAWSALRRKWGAVALLAVAGAVSATPVLPYLPLARGAEPAATAAPLKVLTVNVSFRPFSPRRLLDIIGDANPDVVVIQELTPHAARVLADLDTTYAHHLKFEADGPYGLGLWSRFEIESGTTFALGRLPALQARVRGPMATFTVIGAHLSAPTSAPRAAARNQQLERLAAHAAAVAGPLLVVGDFNITPYSPHFAEWLVASGLTDTRRGRTLSVSWPATLPWLGVPIDHVAVSTDFEVLSHRALPNFESDHYGVLVELALRGTTGAERR